ncbi:hypothetical protein ZWY2020_030582 [Hordeum vulgare]|nr:hypothetical protein ZWY2020_030582 [Hordeum vulgare]
MHAPASPCLVDAGRPRLTPVPALGSALRLCLFPSAASNPPPCNEHCRRRGGTARRYTDGADAIELNAVERCREPAVRGVVRCATVVEPRRGLVDGAGCRGQSASPCARSAVPAGMTRACLAYYNGLAGTSTAEPAGAVDSCQSRLSTVTDSETVLGAQSLGVFRRLTSLCFAGIHVWREVFSKKEKFFREA